MPLREEVVLVDAHDQQIGVEEKQKAHVEGKLHRAFSIFIFNPAGQLLLQRRSTQKYHSSGLWSNSCCSHPQPGEALDAAAHRRLREEMGFDCPLHKAFEFTYKTQLGNGLIEHEFDHVFVGVFTGEPKPNPAEVQSFQWLALETLERQLSSEAESYTYWLHHGLPLLQAYLQKNPLQAQAEVSELASA